MNHALVIASRELAEKRFVFLAAAAFALIAALVPQLPLMHGNRAEGVVVGSGILAAGFALGLAAILGATIVGRDIAAGRMSFYFARPVGGAAIWFGKLAAALVLVVVSFLIAVAPALIAGPMTVRRVWSGNLWQLGAIIGGSALLLFFGAHALGTMVRSRSALLGADFAAVVLVLMVVPTLARPLALGQAAGAAAFLGKSLLVALLVAFVGAGAWQLADGRSDRRRSHRAFSTFFWATVAAALVLAAIFVAWIVSAAPSDLRGRVAALQPPRGDAAIVTGEVPHRFDYRPMFLGSKRINGTVWAAFSRDGQRAVLLQISSLVAPSTQLVVRDAAQEWRATPTQLAFQGPIWGAAATDDLARVAVLQGGIVGIYDVASSRSAGSFRLGGAVIRSMFFVTPNVLRIYGVIGPRIETLEYDVAARSLRKTGEITQTAAPVALRVSPDATRVLLVRRGAPPSLCDARTLQPIAPADLDVHFLQDGRLVKVPGRFVGEIAPGKVLITDGSGTQLFDVDSGRVVAHADGLQPVPAPFWPTDPRPSMRNANGVYTRNDGSVVRWNPLKTAAERAGRSRTAS